MRRANGFLLFIIALCVSSGIYAFLHLEIKENLNDTLPNLADNQQLQDWIDSQKQRLIITIEIQPDQSFNEVSKLAEGLTNRLATESIAIDPSYRNDIDPQNFIDLVYNNLPIYLSENDYKSLDQLNNQSAISKKLKDNKKKLLSPEGIGQRKQLLRDPLGVGTLALQSFASLGSTEDLIKNEGLFLSAKRDKLFIKAQLPHDGSNSAYNHNSVVALETLAAEWNDNNIDNKVSFFGTFLIADINAVQIAKDVKITVSIAVSAILLLLIYYYRKPVILGFFLVPGIFGILSAISFIYWYQGGISGLALAASAIVFGIVADYSFHFFTNFKQNKNAYQTRKEIFFPLLISGTTTIVAFFSLVFAESKTLQDFGLFTSISLAGTLFFVLTGLPILLSIFEKNITFSKSNKLDEWLEKIKIGETSPSKTLLLSIFLLTGIFLYSGFDIQFEDDLQKINFYPEELKAREVALQNIDPNTETRLSVVASNEEGSTAEFANAEVFKVIKKLSSDHSIKELGTVAPILIPQETQLKRIQLWNQYWEGKKEVFLQEFTSEAEKQKWKTKYFKEFYTVINKSYEPTSELTQFITESNTLSELVLNTQNDERLLTTFVCNKNMVEDIKSQINNIKGATVIDGSSMAAKVMEAVKSDFNFLLIYASLAVFIAFLLIYGNLELTLVSFIPMVISWIWVLGIASLLGIKFNFINIILTTFIFGLGDDFSIFVTDGLLHRYKYKKEVLGHYKAGIVLSSISTIVGTGVLFFAQHPALRSIAALSVIGILVIVFITFFVQPLLFRFFILNRTEKGKEPYTIHNLFFSVIGFSFFISGSLIAVALSLFISVIPFLSIDKKKLLTHHVLQKVSAIQLGVLYIAKSRYVGMEHLNFDKPSVIIANHNSFFDILALLQLNPKIVLVVNEWVYTSPLFGSAIRYADFIPSFKNMEEELPKIKALVAKGYSIAIYPEGKRSADGKIGRFHKGAFFLAEELQLDITPIILHGHGHVMSKNDFYHKNGPIDTVVLPRIGWNDKSFGEGYRERTKKISKHFKTAFTEYQFSSQGTAHAFSPLERAYLFKSPILIWYFRIKWRFEKANYENYSQIIGQGKKTIYDLGCGYGYLSYFFWMRDQQRTINGYDYDQEKVDLAAACYLKNEQINFSQAHVEQIEVKDADAIILADVLHYLSEEKQLQTLNNCDKGLNPGGVLLIRDGVVDSDKKHQWTEKSEKWSTKLVKFNKTEGDLHFFTKEFIIDWATDHDYSVEVDQQSESSSNTLFVLRKGMKV
ncbi:MAG: 1-acyl-sn-glycerol-3-phosphate acyltransferase [Reichenbachiella sp.]